MEEKEEDNDEKHFSERLIKFEKRTGTTDYGKEYEVLVVSLVLLRALRKTRRFWLASNHSSAGEFDDVVLLWTNADEESLRCCLIQLKHKANSSINKSALLTTSTKKNDFSIFKYYKSFLEICDHWRRGNFPVQAVTYALYTNAPLNVHPKLKAADVANTLLQLLGTGNGSVASLRGNAEVESLLRAVNDERVEEFLENFGLWYSQARPDELRRCLKEELRNLLALPPGREDVVAEVLESAVKNWWLTEKNCTYLTQSTDIWKEFVVRRVEEVNCNRPHSPNYNFSLTFNRDALRLDQQVTVIIAETELSVLKVTQALAGHDAVLVAEKLTLEVLTLWGGLWCNALVVVGDSELVDAEEILIKYPSKKLVNVLKNKPSYSKWTVLKDSCSLEDFDVQSRNKLLSAKVSFQGHETELKSLFRNEKEAMDSLTAEHLFLLATATTPVPVGRELDSDLPSLYVSRVISRRHLVQKDFLLSVRACGGICAVVGISDTHLRFWLGRIESRVHDLQSAMDRDDVDFVVLPSREDFEELAAKFCPRRDAHLLQYDDGEWRWLRTVGSMKTVRQHLLDEAAVVNEVGDRCAVIVGGPGVGKSALLAKIASEVKQRDSNIWVLRVNLASYARLFAEASQNLDVVHLVEEFARLAEGDSLGRALLRHCLQVSGHLELMLDSVDEISPNYTAQCVSLVKQLLRTTRVRRILLASRPEPRHLMEDAFCILPYGIEPLSRKQQEELLGSHVTMRSSTSKLGDLLGIPLFVNMLSQVWEVFGVDAVSDIRTMFGKFVEMKVRKMFEKKFAVDMTLPAVQLLYADALRRYTEGFRRLSQSLFTETRQDSGVEEPGLLEIAGLVFRRSEDGRLDFVHRTFAEYFLADWACHNLSSARQLIVSWLQREDMEFFTDMFNRMLCQDEAAHKAVIAGDAEGLNMSDVTRRDAGGRSPLHICALYNAAEPTRRLLAGELCPWEAEDFVFQWTAVQYAGVLDAWDFLDAAAELERDVSHVLEEGKLKRALEYCCRRGKLHLLRTILRESSLEYDVAVCDDGGTCLHVAARHGQAETVSELTRGGVAVDVRDFHDATPLHVALDEKTARLLLTAKNLADREGRTSLHTAAIQGRRDVVALLVAEGFDVNLRDGSSRTPLAHAVSRGHVEVVAVLLPRVADKDAADGIGNTALHDAAAFGLTGLLNVLLDAGLNLEARSVYGYTPLLLAVHLGRKSSVETLLKRGANRNAVCGSGATALHLAASSGNDELVRHFLELGADLRDGDGETPLLYAARSGFDAFLSLAKSSDLNARGKSGCSALHYAAMRGLDDIAKFLLNSGVDVEARDKFEWTPLIHAVWNRRREVAKLLLGHGAAVDARERLGATALHKAAFNGDETMARILLEAGAQADSRRKDGSTPLIMAAIKGHGGVARLLLGHGADAQAVDNEGKTALYIAAAGGHVEFVSFLMDLNPGADSEAAMLRAAFEDHEAVVRVLVMSGANVNARDERRATVLFHAARSGKRDLVDFLLDHGADIDAEASGWDGQTPLQCAVRWGQDEAAETLVRRGARNDLVDSEGNTLLIKAASNGLLRTVKLLAEMGGVNAANRYGATAILCAARSGAVDVVECLSHFGASKLTADEAGQTLVHHAAAGGNVGLLSSLISEGFEPNVTDNAGRTPLHVAAARSGEEAVRWLVDTAGANRYAVDIKGHTALHHAIHGGSLRIVQYLVTRGLDADAKTTHGTTPLLLAAQLGREETVRWLVSSVGASVEQVDADGDTLLHCAAFSNRLSLVRCVLDLLPACAIDATNRRGETPLLAAISRPLINIDIVLLLTERSARVDVVDAEGNGVLHWAASHGNIHLLRYFMKCGVNVEIKNNRGLSPADLASLNGKVKALKLINTATNQH